MFFSPIIVDLIENQFYGFRREKEFVKPHVFYFDSKSYIIGLCVTTKWDVNL